MRQQSKTLFLLLVSLGLLSCSLPAFRASPAVFILRKAEEGDQDYLRKLSLSPRIAADLVRRKAGSAYYLGLIYQDLGLPRQAEILFTETFARDREPWRKEAGRALHLLLSRGEGEKPMTRLARRFGELYPEDPAGRLFLLQALEREGRYRELINQYEGFSEKPDSRELFSAALAEKKLDRPELQARIQELFLHGAAHQVHSRALNELVSPAWYSPAELSYFRAKASLARGAYGEALPGYRTAPAPYRHSPVFLSEYGDILLKTAQHKKGILDLEEALPHLSGEALLTAREQLGKLYRQSGAYPEARARLRDAREQWESEGGTPIHGDRILWYLLSSSLRQSPLEFLREYALRRRKIYDPSYFSDLFDGLAAELLRLGHWDMLREAYELTRETAGTDHARFAFLLAQAVEAGLFQPPPGLPPPEELLEIAYHTGGPYHSILAGVALGKPLPFSPGGNPGVAARNMDMPGEDLFLRGFEDFGIPGKGIRAARGFSVPPDPASAARLAKLEGAQGRYIEGLRLLAWASRARPAGANRLILENLYPRAFQKEIDGVVGEFSLPPAVFYALIREESYFDPSIRSHVGATGLAQLMPATAREVARALRIADPDLTDPATNLRLGGRHLADLARRLGPGVFYLSAYNAGGGRLNQWRRQIRGLPQALFAEALPFAETRDYIRKVLVAAVHYGYLYEGKDPIETVAEIFSDFPPHPIQQETP